VRMAHPVKGRRQLFQPIAGNTLGIVGVGLAQSSLAERRNTLPGRLGRTVFRLPSPPYRSLERITS
jgi:hypothetical protein